MVARAAAAGEQTYENLSKMIRHLIRVLQEKDEDY
jgi:hypothetical protein